MKIPDQFRNNWGVIALIVAIVFLVVLFLAMAAAVFTSGESRFAACGFIGLMILGLFVAIPITALVFSLTKLRNAGEAQEDTTYNEFAKAVNGRVVQRRQAWQGKTRAVEFSCRGFPSVIDSITKRNAEGYSYFMRFVVELAHAPEFQCQIAPEHFLDPRSLYSFSRHQAGMAGL